jgi:putative NADPH-quinone reductase
MKILVVLAHPNPGSFNHAIAGVAVQALKKSGHDVIFHDLYAEGFQPVLSRREIPKGAPVDGAIQRHCQDLASADGIVVVHPNWWGMPPAILKGWVDRVIRPGVAYEFLEGDSGEGVPRGLLRARAALVFNTANTAPEREQTAFGDPLQTIWENRDLFTGKKADRYPLQTVAKGDDLAVPSSPWPSAGPRSGSSCWRSPGGHCAPYRLHARKQS